MDCGTEEQLIRLKLAPLKQVRHLEFNIPDRKLEVYYTGDFKEIQQALKMLNLNDQLETTIESESYRNDNDVNQRRILWWVLSINFGFFLVEVIYGWLSDSMGLLADSLDMLADSLVYGLSLLAVGAYISRKQRIARISGYLQIFLAIIGVFEVGRRFIASTELPNFRTMITVSFLALIANAISLLILRAVKSQEVHIKASWIFTSNDIVINMGVIIAGVLVFITNSKFPDLIIGLVVFIIVLRGARRILNLT